MLKWLLSWLNSPISVHTWEYEFGVFKSINQFGVIGLLHLTLTHCPVDQQKKKEIIKLGPCPVRRKLIWYGWNRKVIAKCMFACFTCIWNLSSRLSIWNSLRWNVWSMYAEGWHPSDGQMGRQYVQWKWNIWKHENMQKSLFSFEIEKIQRKNK